MRVLLISPLFYGHVVVYYRVLSKILLEQGATIQIASFGISKFDFSEWLEIAEDLRARMEIVDLGGKISPSHHPLSAERIVDLQRQYAADITLFVHADHLREEFIRIGQTSALRLLGRNIGLFSSTSAWYPGEDPFSGKRTTWVGPTVRRTLGNLKRLVFNHRATDRYFFEECLIARRVLDAIWIKDERIADRFGPPVFWMPDIYKVFHERLSDAGRQQYERIAEEYGRFVSRAAQGELFLYFGNAAWYKGYDLALQLAARDESAYFVHCGRGDLGDHPYEFDVHVPHERLTREGRIYVTGEYIIAQSLIELFFSSVQRVVSTHRLTASSGTMLQALECGKPTLTPRGGLIGHRTVVNRLGPTYEHGNLDSLHEQWSEFRQNGTAGYRPHLEEFISRFSEQALIHSVRRAVLNA